MTTRWRGRWTSVWVCGFLMGAQLWPLIAQGRTGTPPNQAAGQTPSEGAPADLRPLLVPRTSELRLVVTRYSLDRSTLNGNFAGGRGGRGAAAVSPVPVSPGRIARLKRFDMDWQAALGKIDASRLSPAARTDLDTLKSTVAANLRQLDIDGATLAIVMPAVPFAPKLVQLIESRIRIEDMNAQKTAAALDGVIRDIAAFRARLDAGLKGETTAGALRLTADVATRGADATDALRSQMAEWFGFYNGYDPMFTWWMGLLYKHFDAAMLEYAAFLRQKVAAADVLASQSTPMATPIPPAPAPKFSDVPDLQEIINLPQDEMMSVVQRFLAGAGRRGGRGNGAAEGVNTNTQYYADWLTALKTLDFDKLTRNAQVDYLYLKRTSESRIARAGVKLDPNPPRKADNSGLPGVARGRDGLLLDLAEEMIPYTPEQLMTLADKEYAWCEAEMKKASRQMGFGDDWKKAVEKTKETFVPPGAQPAMIRDLLTEAVDYLRANDLVTVPAVGAESMHMVMMSPQAQLANPFFLGGAQIQVSYPTDTMEYEARMESMRGNNPGFSHATAFHEMIPGHYLTNFMDARYIRQGYRADFGISTPFFTEGWALYWELTMYDLGFDKTPEQKVGALFWRMHRCARIIFSLKFHMGEWSPQECVDFLIDKVGHERDNATAEVRRSFQGNYGPLYQAGYLLGGLQLRGLRKELVDSGQLTNRQFHDEILRQGTMPVALIRLAVTKQKITRDMSIDWKFYGDIK